MNTGTRIRTVLVIATCLNTALTRQLKAEKEEGYIGDCEYKWHRIA